VLSLKAKVPAFDILKTLFVSERLRIPPIVKPPLNVVAVDVVAPRPVTVDKVSASADKALEDMEIVEPEVEIVTLPEPLTGIDAVNDFAGKTNCRPLAAGYGNSRAGC